ncbi:MAG: redoxin domain-containing protein [Myxococcales bacterium]|nr:redoxin domain-containing protein [Myxococcales bacterium]
MNRHHRLSISLCLVAVMATLGCSKKAKNPAKKPTAAVKKATGDEDPNAAVKTPKAVTPAVAATVTVAPPAPPPPVLAKVGAYAPDFELPSVDGQTMRMSTYKGQIIVLEWFNPDCPFVKRAHKKGPLKDMARRWQDKGVFWIAINSGAPGKQGHGRERNAAAIEEFGLNHAVLLDETGAVGKKYGADHTPHVFVIDGLGKLRYAGALNNMPYGEVSEPGQQPLQYLEDALEAVARGQDAPVQQTKSWGCSVKYAK